MHLTNFKKEELSIYEQAIKKYVELTNDDILFIDNSAYDNNSILLTNCKSLHVKTNKDLTTFWKIFDDVKKYSGKFITLTKNELLLNMQYYMEYCQLKGYVTPQDWIEKYKHF